MMSPPPKGKAPTKGAKQILAENEATVLFYRHMSMGATALYNVIFFVFFYNATSALVICMNILVAVIFIICHLLMRFISRPRFSENQQLIDPGLDLNMEGGMGEHVKDIVILTSISHSMAIISNYFWLMLLLIPARCFWLIWVNFLGPWFFQEAPEDTEQDEKKRKKMERKMKRSQQ